MTKEKMLTVKEVAEYLNISDFMVRYYIGQGLLKAHKLGVKGNGGSTTKKNQQKTWRIKEKDVQEFLDRGSNIKEG